MVLWWATDFAQNMKLQHWRGVWSKNASKPAPMLEIA
jgi:hypothetical protein